MWLGLTLALQGNRETRGRLLATAIGVMLGTCLLFSLLAGLSGLNERDMRRAWLDTSASSSMSIRAKKQGQVDPLLWNANLISHKEQPINLVTVAATGTLSPKPPGIPAIPPEGQYYASPALARTIAATPDDELGDRFGGTPAGILADDALNSPDALIAIQGANAKTLHSSGQSEEVFAINTRPQGYSAFMQTILGIGIMGVLFPIVVFIATSARLGAAAREERFAALRLIGATPAQVRGFAATESAITAAVGALLGLVLFTAIRPLLANVSIGSGTFFVADLAIPLVIALATIVAVIVLAICGSLFSLRRVTISPLGVSRQAKQKPPRAWRILPLLGGLMLIIGLAALPDVTIGFSTSTVTLLIYCSFALILFGLVFAGPWLTKIISRLLARQSGSAASLIALRRIENNPSVTFRAVSGVVIAIFMVSAYSGAANSVLVGRATDKPGSFQSDEVAVSFQAQEIGRAEAQTLQRELAAQEGVRSVAPVYESPETASSEPGPVNGIIACQDAMRLGIGTCQPGATYASIPNAAARILTTEGAAPSQLTTATVPDITALPLSLLIARTDGSPATIERAKTAIITNSPIGLSPITQADFNVAKPLIEELQRLAYAGIIATIVISAASLAVAVLGGIFERRRSFSILRLGGMPMRTLQAVVVIESALPLIAVSVLSAGLGLTVAGVLLSILTNNTLQFPPLEYYGIIGASIAAALLILATTLPLMKRLTGFDSNRSE